MAVTNNFASSTLDLNGQTTISGPTALVWGPDGRLYVTEVGGTIKVLTVAFGDPDPTDGDNALKFYVTEAFDLTSVIGFNYNDDGAANPNVSEQGRDRQVTGIDVVQQYDTNGDPVFTPDGKPAVDIYVTSSDPRHGAGNNGADKNLDTNSGVVHRLREIDDVDNPANADSAFQTVDLVRGFARSEENHSINGLEVIQEFDSNGKLVSERAIVAVGGNANTGAPSNNFAAQPEYATSAAIFEIDITMLDGMTVQTDQTSPGVFRDYIYDLPTLDDPSQGGADDTNDPFGGNDGFNGTKLLSNADTTNPVKMYSPGYRNSYDVEVTDDGRVWTYDNGANNSWGGRPIGEAGDNGGTVDFAQDPNYIATNLNNGDGNNNDEINLEDWNPSNNDNFHEITRSDDLGTRSLSVGGNGAVTTYTDPDTGLTLVYGGHPNPTRAEGSAAGLLFSPKGTDEDTFLLVSDTNNAGDGGPSDYDQVIAWFTQVEGDDTNYPTQGVFGADAGELTKRVIEATPGVLYDIYEENNGTGLAVPTGAPAPSGTATFIGTAGLPADIHDVVANANPIEGNYLEAGATDGALDSGGGSINGLAEYTSTILDDLPGVKMSGAILASQFNGGGIIVMGRNADGTMSSVAAGDGTLAADRTIIPDSAQTLGLATLGDNVQELGLSNAFQGSIWLASYKIGSNFEVSLEVLQPEGVGLPLADQIPVNTTDQDGDGVDYINDSFEFSADNGYALAAGETINIDFEANDTTSFPGSFGGIGLMGAALDGTTPNQDAQTPTEFFPPELQRDGLFNDGENLIPGGNAPVFQIKNVVEGTVVGSGNTARDAMQTGIKLDPDVKSLVATTNIKNWVSSGIPGATLGQVTGMMFSDGTQSNFLRVVFGGVNSGGTNVGIEVGFEIGDANYTVLGTAEVSALLLQANTDIDLRLAISNIGTSYDVSVQYKLNTESDFTEVPLNGGSGFSLPPGVLQNVLDGTHTISDGDGPTLTSGAAIGILAETPTGVSLEAVDYNNILIEAFANEIFASTGPQVGTPGTPDVDTIVYTGTDTVLAPLASDVENFDGSGSSANYAFIGNNLDNRIELGAGANTVTTGGGADTIIGTIAQLSGDDITDMSVGDTLIISDLSTADVSGASYAANPAALTIGGGTITFSGPDFDEFETGDGPSVFRFADGPEGLEVTVLPPNLNETVIYRINFGADGTVAAVDGGPDWIDDDATTPGFSTNAPNTFNTPNNVLTVEFDNVDPTIVPAAVFNSERGDNDPGGTPTTLNFDVEAGKTYRIEYFYTENWQNSFTAEPRIFSVSVDGVVPAAFQNLQPLAESEAFAVANGAPTIAEATASGGTLTNAEKNLYLNVGRKAEYVYTAVDNQINLALLHSSQNPKVNAVQISEIVTPEELILVSIFDPAPVVEGGDTGDTTLTFQLEVADQGFTGALTLDFDVTIGETTQSFVGQTVNFVDSDATIVVTVPNDIQNNGDDSVSVTLLGVSEAEYGIDAAAATATSAVTEDDAPVNPGFPFAEATDGDLSDDRFDPTDLGALALGDNLVTATQQGDGEPGGRERDYFTFEVPEGQVLTQLILEDYVAGEPTLPQGFMGLSAGPIMDVDPLTLDINIPNLLGGKVYGETDIGMDILPDFADGNIVGNVTTAGFALPLPAGIYTLWFNQGGEASTPTINLTSELASALPEVSIADAPDVTEGGDVGTTTLAFPVSLTAAEGATLDLTFSIAGGPNQTQSVVFNAAGAGLLTVDVTNDDVFTGDRDFEVTLISVDSGVPGESFVVSETSGSATGTVLEDEELPSTAPTGDFDNDGVLNENDTDIDGDAGGGSDNSISTNGILNIQEAFVFDPTSTGTVLTAGQVVLQDFDVDGTPFMNGFTGGLPSPTNNSAEINLNNADVSGGTLNITATKGDHFNNTNDQENAFVAAYTAPDGLSVETRFAIPDFDAATSGNQAPTDFQAAGVVIGVDQNNMVKAVWGRVEPEFQLVQDFGGNPTNVLTPGTVPSGAAEISIILSVFTDEDSGVATASAAATFYDASGVAIPGSTDIDLGTVSLVNNASQNNNLKTLVESGAALGAGVIQTSTGTDAPDSFVVSYDYVEVTALGTPQVGDVAPTVALENQLTSIPEDQDLSSSLKVADIVITDDGLSTVTPTLSGDDFALFEIVDNGGALELHIQAGVTLDFETSASLDVSVSATDAVGTGTASFSAAVTDANDAPTITGAIADTFTVQGTPTTVDLSSLVLADEDTADAPFLKVLINGIDVASVAGFTLNGAVLEVDETAAINDYSVEVFANDGVADSESAITFSVEVVDPSSPFYVRGNVLEAYNAGGGTVTFDGIDFVGALNDGGVFAGGEDFTDPNNGNNGNQTFANQVFETEVNGGPDDDSTPGVFTATLAVPQERVFLDLYFAEIFASGVGDRVFDISVNGVEVVTNLDILAQVGGDPNTPLVIELPDAIEPDSSGNIVLTFTADEDRAKISALVVREAVDINSDVAPTVELQNAVAAIPEDQDLSTSFKVADIIITDDGGSQVTPSLSGDDADLFTIVDNGGALELHLQAEALLDFETNPDLDVTVEATDAIGTGTAAFSASVTDANDAPTISGTIADTTTTEGTPATVDLSALLLADEDAADTPVLKVLIDGVDVGSVAGFTLNGTTLEVDDTVAIGDYAVEVFANDGVADSESAVAFSVEVTDPSEPVYVRGGVLQAYNAGGAEVTFDGITFAAALDGDGVFAGGQNFTDASDDGNGDQTFANPVFETEVNGGPNGDGTPGVFTATLAVPQERVFLDLYFAEIFASAVGTRIFDISVNGVEVVTDLDILAQVGGDPNTPLIIELPDAIEPDESGNIVVTFSANSDRAKISALVVREATEAPTDVAPVVALQNAALSVAEDTDLSTSLKVADIVITDDGVSTVTPTLSGDDSGLFTIVDNGGALELHLQAEALLDFETNPTLDVTVEATDAAGTGTAAFSVPVTDANDAPTITGTVADAATTVGTPTTVDLSALVLTDEDVTDTPVLKVLIDGIDVGSVAGFTLNGTTLEVEDTVAIGDYAVEVFANDGEADSESAVTFSVGVGASSSPVPTLAVVVPTETEGDIVVTIDFGEPVFGLSASAVTLTNALGLSRTDGTTSFVDGDSTATLTFTAPAGGFAQDTTYTASILEGVVTDIDGNSNDAAASEPAAFGIDDGPVFVSGADDIDLAENTAGALATYQAVDADGDDVTYSLSPSGTAAGFQIDAISGLLTAPSFDFETQPTSYTFDVIASSTGSDAVAKTATQSVTVTILDESNENGTQSDDVIDIDEEQDVVVLSTGGDNSGGDDIVSGDTQTLDGLVIVNVEEGDGVEFDDEGILGVEVLGLSQGSVLLDVDVDTGSGFDGVADAQIEISGSEITEEALNNGSLTENDFQVNGTQIVFAPVDETETVEFEVEDFDDVFPINQSQDNQFFEENQGAASGGQVARLGSNDTGVATLQLGAGDGVIFGNNNIVVTYFDESDGVSTFELKINGVSAGSVTLDNDGGGNAAQSSNIRSATFNNVSVPLDAVVTLEGSSNLGEFLRLDKIAFTSTGGGTGNPDNQAPIAVGTIDLSGLTQGDTINIPLEGASPIFVDPDEDTMIFSLSENAPDFLSIVDGVIVNDRPITNQDVVDSAALGPIQVTVTASDGDATATSDFDVVVLNANDAPILVPENIGTLDLVTSENEITPIDASAYFDDPDFLISGNLEALEYEATGLPPGLAIDPQTGIISGALTVPDSYAVSITATDLGNLSVTANFTINVTGEPVLGDPIRIQVEDFDNISDPGGFFVEGQGAADENQVARLGANGSGEATLALDDVSGFSPGSYNLTLGFFDENDGDSTVVVKIRTFDSGGVPSDTIVGTVVFDADAGGNAAQASSFRQVTLNGLTIPAGATLVLEGDAEGYDQAEADLDPDRTVGNEFVRLDYVDLIPTVGNPGNFAPFPIPGFDTALEAPEGNADFSVAAAFGDPEEDILSFALKALPNGDPLPDFLQIDPVTGIISMVGSSVSEDTTFEFEVTATDVNGSGQTATQTFTLLVTDVPLPSVAATVESSVIEGIDSFVAVALADTPTIQDPVTVRLVLVPGTSIPPATPGLDIAFDEFGATTIDVTFTQGAQGIVPLIVADDGPIDDLESFRVEIIAANVGSTIDGGATPVPFAQFSGDGIISDADDAPVAVDEAQTVFAGSDVTFDPTASDTDADATQLTLVSIDTTATVGGTVTENPDGTVTVAADPGATGTISFGYTVADDFGNQTIGTEVVTITSEALISIAPTATAVEDGDTGTTPVVIDLTVTPAAAGTVDVEFSLDGGTTTSVATVTFDALGAGTLTIDVDGFNDAVDDGDDTATVTLIGSPTEGFAVDPSNAVSTATITEDDTLLPDTVVLRINAFGADQAPSDGGPTWLGDVTGGGAANYLQVTDDRGDDFGYSGDPLAIPDGITEEVLDTARSSDFAFSYAIPVSDLDGAGNYRVKLYVAELFGNFQGGGFRIFDSSLEGVVPAAFDDIDPGTQFGADVGVLTADVTVSDGTLNIAFVPDVAQFPIINGIEIIKLGGDPADVEGPTASIALTSPDSAAGALVVEITLADASGVSEASLGDEDIDVLVGEQVVPAENVTFVGFDGSVATYTVAPPVGGWLDGDEVSVTLAAGEVLDLAPGSNGNAETTEFVTLTIGDPPADASLTGDLDNDLTPNNADDDIDGDGISNLDDRAAYNASNAGPDLATVETIEFDFTNFADGASPFEAGLDGVTQTADGTPEIDYATNNGAVINGGRLQFQTTEADTNDAENGFSFLADVSGGDFTFEGTFDNPVAGGTELTSFAQYGLIISVTGAPGASTGADGDFLKFTTGNPGAGLELSGRGSFASPDAKTDYPTGVTATNFAQVHLEVTAQNGAFSGAATYLDDSGATLGVANLGPISPTANSALANILSGASSVQPAFGVTSTDFGANGSFTVGVESLTLSDGAGDPPTNLDDAISILQAAQGVDVGGVYNPGDVGSAQLRIMEGVDNVQASNFGGNSFLLENTGGKQIAAVFIDFRDALYSDSVIDPDGAAGDNVTNPFAAQSGAGATGLIASGNDNVLNEAESLFLPGDEPNPDPNGAAANGGFRGLLLRFDGSSGGFSNGEVVGFAGDMDPNSIANSQKSTVDSNAVNDWDVGGVSGAELIGSAITVMFDDGTFATGYLGSNGTQAGSTGTASQASPSNQVATVTVNGAGSGVQGVYGGTEPEIVVSGTPGATVLVTMSKGLNPVTNTASNAAQDTAARLQNSHPEFQASNAGDFQTVQVTIGANGTFTLQPGAFDYNQAGGGITFDGSAFTEAYATAPMVIAASVVDSNGEPSGPVDRVYLASNGVPVDPVDPPIETGGYFEGNGNPGGNYAFKVQIENASEASGNGGLDPNGQWTFFDAPDPGNFQQNFQGEGYYLYGSTSSLANNQQPGANEILEFTILIPEGAEGTYTFRMRVARDQAAESDKQNDAWINFQKQGTNESIEEYLTNGEPEPLSQGFLKLFGGPNNGQWGFATQYDQGGGGPATQLAIDEPGLYTIQIAGRSQGFHIDYWELYKGNAPGVGASNSDFIVTGPSAPTLDDPIDDVVLVAGNGTSIDAASAFSDLDGDDLDFLISAPNGITIDEETGLITVENDLAVGTYTVTVTAFDDDNNQVSDTFDIEVVDQLPGQTITIPISTGNDDWEQKGAGGSADLELGDNGGQQYAALRFTGIDIPAGATITSAFIRFTAQETNNAPAEFTVAIEDNEQAAPYTVGNPPVSGQRPLIEQFTWDPEGWTAGQEYETPSLAGQIASVVGPDGVSGGDLSFVIDGVFGSRVADSFNSPGNDQPELVITYEFGSVDPTEPEVVDPIDDVNLIVGNGTTFDASSAFDDADGDDLDYEISGPTGVSIDEETGLVTIADTLAEGTYNITVTAEDDDNNSVDDTFQLTINPVTPTEPTVVDPIDDVSLALGTGTSFDASVAFEDLDGDDLDFEISGPTGVTIDEETGVVTIADTLSIGTYQATVTASDDDQNEVSDIFEISVTDQMAGGSVTVSIASSDDDWEQFGDGESDDFELGQNGFRGQQWTALRFTDLDIPVGATITSAVIRFTAQGSSGGTAEFEIGIEDTDSASAFTLADSPDPAERMYVDEFVWTENTAWIDGQQYDTPDLSAQLAGVLGTGGADGADIAFVLDGISGSRVADSFDTAGDNEPELIVMYDFI